jgi:hypothetical protein
MGKKEWPGMSNFYFFLSFKALSTGAELPGFLDK